MSFRTTLDDIGNSCSILGDTKESCNFLKHSKLGENSSGIEAFRRNK
jgi:hypothetical protein